MLVSHGKTVSELESRWLEQERKYKAEIAERDDEITRAQQLADERLKDIEKLASDEKEALLAKIRFL